MQAFKRSAALLLIGTVVLAASGSLVRAQQKKLTIADLYDPSRAIVFGGRPVGGLVWQSDTRYIWPRPGNGGVDWLSVDAASGGTQPLYDVAKMEAALAKVPGVSGDQAKRLSRSRGLTFSPNWTGALVTIENDLYFYPFGAGDVTRLTSEAGEEEIASFSPNGRLVAFTRGGNLYVVDLAEPHERAVTTDGGREILDGRLDWVYEEELYGRGNKKGYWWSPDSTTLAFLQLNEKPVPEFTVVDHIPYHLNLETWDYPKAGDPNPTARLGIVGAAGGPVTWADTSKYAGIDFLIVNVAWHPDSRSVFYQIQNREQSWLDLNVADRPTGSARTILRETSKAWVNCGNVGCQDDDGNPIWLRDGSFLWFSERSGWRHLYRYHEDGTLVRSVTSGRWEVRAVHGVDEPRGWIYFSGTERSPIGQHVYRVKLDGSGFERLSGPDGLHAANFSRGFSYYIDRWSDVRTPPQTRLHQADGRELRVLDENRVAALGEYRLSKPDFVQVKARDGFVMEAMMIKPPDFDSRRKYPVYQFVYGGPHTQTVFNRWAPENMFLQLLAEQGILVWECDNRTASGKGAESAWPVFRRFGESELRDVEDCLTWLKQQPYVDDTRIGIHGWSYGGFLTAYALTHSTRFTMGIAGGTVSDWKNYDTIYTERYLQTPQTNPDGYRDSSPRFSAGRLHGRLLLIHGMIDDNVHVQNTLQLADELERANKPFELMMYPRSRHGITDPQLVYHMRTTMLRFILENLKPAGAATTAPVAQ